MKTILAIIALGTVTTIGYSQGTVILTSVAAPFSMYTNTGLSVFSGGDQSGGVSGETASTANGFDYILLDAPLNSVSSTDPLASGWLNSLVTAENATLAGGVIGLGLSGGTTAANWGAPTGNNYSDGTEDNYLIVGWSSNLGATWSTVSAELAAQFDNFSYGSGCFFGVSDIGQAYSGGGSSLPTLNPVNLLNGVTGGAPGGLASGFSMYEVGVIPEPTTMALAGMGGLSLLALRRRK